MIQSVTSRDNVFSARWRYFAWSIGVFIAIGISKFLADLFLFEEPSAALKLAEFGPMDQWLVWAVMRSWNIHYAIWAFAMIPLSIALRAATRRRCPGLHSVLLCFTVPILVSVLHILTAVTAYANGPFVGRDASYEVNMVAVRTIASLDALLVWPSFVLLVLYWRGVRLGGGAEAAVNSPSSSM